MIHFLIYYNFVIIFIIKKRTDLEEKKYIKKTFNVYQDAWDEFIKLCKRENSDTNKELRKFIDQYNKKHRDKKES